MPDFPTYTDPTLADAQSSADYQAGVGQIDAQAGLNQKTYAQTRQDLINSYQSTLDNLNYGLKQAGLQARGQYAGRNLYNASGSLSGTGELVGTELTQPITSQITNAQTAHESNLQKLALQEQQGNLDTQTAKQTLLKNVLGNLQTSAKQKYNANVDSYQAAIKAKEDEAKAAAEAAKLPGGAIDVLKVIQDQQAKGRTLLYQKDLAGAVKQYGNDSIIKIGNQKFLLSPSERVELAKAKKSLTTAGKRTTKSELDAALNTDLNAFNGRVVTRGVAGPGQATREQIIEALAQDYPHRSRGDIAKEVYAAYGDTYR